MPNKLPPYFQEYLDDKFDRVFCELQEMKDLNKILGQRVSSLEAFKVQLLMIVVSLSVGWTLFGNAVNGFFKDIFGHLYKN